MMLGEISKKIKEIKMVETIIRFSMFFFYLIFIYMLFTLFKPDVINIYYLYRLILLIKYSIIFAIAVIIAIFISPFYASSASMTIGFEAAIKTLATILLFSPQDVNNIINFNNYLMSEFPYFIYELITTAFILICLLGFGSVFSGRYSYILNMTIILILLLPFSYVFDALAVEIPQISQISDIPRVINSKFAIFLIITFFFIELSRASGYVPNLLNPLKERLIRIQQMLRMLARGEVKEKARVTLQTSERLSRISKVFLKDAYTSYAFIDRSSLMYISSKLHAFIRDELKKNPRLLDNVSGIAALPSISEIFVGFIKSLLPKVFLAILLALASFSIPIFYQHIGILEVIGIEFSVMLSLILAMFLFIIVEYLLRS